ncbi:hypothetical protein Glove_357g39 [Diversispora epigaea]|uniref:Uncharacterized protein n=1 Tax=Diversispora epigaea TaxID=1348612 RepID=A0A397HAT3_9GLOM|nr:hypothetical protein Glove_357g39 [Diversispora epigaea]
MVSEILSNPFGIGATSLAERNTIQAKQEEILCWYYYGKDFEKMVSEILSNPFGIGASCKNNKRTNDLARDQTYDEMLNIFQASHVKICTNLSRTYKENEVDVSPESCQTIPQPQKTSAYIHAYFHNKLLEQYPNLYEECSSENVDYYGINVESLCPIYKLNHEDEEGIKGEYKDESYYIKCETSEIGTVMPVRAEIIVQIITFPVLILKLDICI